MKRILFYVLCMSVCYTDAFAQGTIIPSSSTPCAGDPGFNIQINWESFIENVRFTFAGTVSFTAAPTIELVGSRSAIIRLPWSSGMVGRSVTVKVLFRSHDSINPFDPWRDRDIDVPLNFIPHATVQGSVQKPADPYLRKDRQYRFLVAATSSSGVQTYRWYIDNVLQQPTGSDVNLSFASVGAHTVTYKPVNSCGQEGTGISTSVTVYCEPAGFYINGPGFICPDTDGIYLEAMADQANGTGTYIWTRNGQSFSGNDVKMIKVTQTGDYRVQATFPNGCVGELTQTVQMGGPPVSAITSVTGLKSNFSNQATLLEVVGGDDATNFDWDVANITEDIFQNANGRVPKQKVWFTPKSPGNLTILVTPLKNTCRGTSFEVPFESISEGWKNTGDLVMDHADLNVANGTVSYLYLPKHSPNYNGCFKQLGPVTLDISLDLGENYNLGKNAFRSDVTIAVTGYSDVSGAGETWTFPLHIDQDAPEQLFSKRITTVPERIRFFKIVTSGYSTSTQAAANIVRLKATYREEDIIDVSNVTLTLADPVQDPENRRWEQTFSWTSSCADVPDYVFQLLKQDGTTPPEQGDPAHWSEATWKNALLIQTESSNRSVTLSMGEGTGIYYWRVIPLGNQPGGITNPENWGQKYYGQPLDYKHPEANKNWTYSRTFTEGNKVTESVVYANGLLRPGQQLTRVQTPVDDKKWIVGAQTVQDHEGRNAVSSLAIPVTGATTLGYVEKLITNEDGAPYGPADFDGLKKPGKAVDKGGYYSGDYLEARQNERVPSAQGYPFAQSVFLNDGTGRVKEQASAGLAHSKEGGHTVRTYYSNATEAEMLSLFGKEAPLANAVQKVITYDANNVASVSFQTKDGKVIATALLQTGDTSIPLKDLESAGADSTFFEYVKDKQRVNETTVVSRKELLLTKPGGVVVNYEITPAQLQELCGGSGSSDLVGYYPFDGNVQDQSGRQNHGVAMSGATPANDARGQLSAYSLAGSTTSYLSVPDGPDMQFGTRDFTVSFWVKRNSATATTWTNAPGVGKWKDLTVAGSNEWALLLRSEAGSLRPAFMVEFGTTPYKAVADVDLTVGAWYHLVGVRQRNQLKIYVNGRLAGTYTIPGSTPIKVNTAGQPLQVARTGTFGTSATFDDVQVYRRAISDAEVKQLQDRGTLCMTCDYTVSFSLFKDGVRVSDPNIPSPRVISAGACANQRLYKIPSFTLSLPGETQYVLEKTLTLNNKTKDSVKISFIDSAAYQVELFYRAKAKARLKEINGFINRGRYDSLNSYLATVAVDDPQNNQYILSLLPPGTGGCQQLIYIPKAKVCPPKDSVTADGKMNGLTFEEYFEQYYAGRTDIPRLKNGVLEHLFFTNMFPGAVKEQYFLQHEFDVMVNNLVHDNGQLAKPSETVYQRVWRIWKTEVMGYEANLKLQVVQDNAAGLENALPGRFSLLRSFLNALDGDLQRELKENEDVCTSPEGPRFIKRKIFYGRIAGAVTPNALQPDRTRAYELVYYDSEVPGMKNMFRFYAGITIDAANPVTPREPVVTDTARISPCDKYRMSQATNIPNPDLAQAGGTADAEALGEKGMSDLRSRCATACEGREEEFNQALIAKLMDTPGTVIEHYSVRRDSTYQNAAWLGVLDSTKNTVGYTISQCDLVAMTTALVRNCKENYCDISLTAYDQLLPNRNDGAKIRIYGTPEEREQLMKPVRYDFKIQMSDATADCGPGWDVIKKSDSTVNDSHIEWVEAQEPGYNHSKIEVDASGNVIYLGYLSVTGDFSANLYKRAANGSIIMKKVIQRLSPFTNNGTRPFSSFSASFDQTGGIIVVARLVAGDIYDFDPGSGVTSLGGANDSYLAIARYDADGQLMMAKSTLFTFYDQFSEWDWVGPEVDIDPNGNIYLKSEYVSADLDFSASQRNIQRTGTGFSTVFVKYDANLVYLWHVTMTSPVIQYPKLVIDGAGSPVIATNYQGNNSQAPVLRNASGDLLFPSQIWEGNRAAVIKLTEDGEPNWVRVFSINRGVTSGLTIGDNNSIYLTGYGATGGTSTGVGQYMLKLNTLGDRVWDGDFYQGIADLYNIAYDKKSNSLALSGVLSAADQVDFDFSEKNFVLENYGERAFFVTNYSVDRDFINAEVLAYAPDAASAALGTNVAYDGKVYIGGLFGYPTIDNNQNVAACLKYKLSENRCLVTKNICFQFTDPRTLEVKIPESLKDYTFDPKLPTCEQETAAMLHATIDQQVEQLISSRVASYRAQYYRTCSEPSKINDRFVVVKKEAPYHFTLYYYDRAGNLMRTVPPEGVVRLAVNGDKGISDAKKTIPPHRMVTEYQYNAAGQLIRQHSPDGNYLLIYDTQGTTATPATGFGKPSTTDDASLNASKYYSMLIYNDKGMLRFSRNAQQKIDGRYSYTKYDELGRVIEVGEARSYNETVVMASRNEMGATSFPVEELQFVTRTVYSQPFDIASIEGWPLMYQQDVNNLLNRVSFTYLDTDGKNDPADDRTYTIYDYDVHGNVRWLVQKMPGLSPVGMRYEYDLLTRSIKEVAFSPENSNASFYHRYQYDADKRLKKVQTSRDGRLWETDAVYSYYLHGALKRTVLGEDLVQGIDYTYTIQGWLKGINHGILDPNIDPGGDAAESSIVGRDAFGMALGYYAGDYINISETRFAEDQPGNFSPKTGEGLFNGNIVTWTSNMLYPSGSGINYPQLTANKYTYDRLNRLLTSRFHTYDAQASGDDFTAVDRYKSKYTYDANGNIMKAVTGSNTATDLDRITYKYELLNNSKVNNRLNSASDSTGLVNGFSEDLEPGQVAYNYQYDAIGNLIRDLQQHVVVTWNAYGKVEDVTRTQDGKNYVTDFIYDAAGNRVVKKRINPGGLIVSDYYVRDGAGNIMGVYQKTEQEGQPTETLVTELPIYGSDRLGTYSRVLAGLGGGLTETEEGELRISKDGIKSRYEESSYLLNADVELTIGSGFEYRAPTESAFRIRVGLGSNEQQPELSEGVYTRVLDSRRYELNDHLSNILVTITDVKLSSWSGQQTEDYRPDVTGTFNYYPFGLAMPSRTWENGSKYRYGFNGKEKDQNGEWGSTNYDYGFRIYNPAIGKFLSVDPLTTDYPWYTPYQFAGNMPINSIDLDGLEPTRTIQKWSTSDGYQNYGFAYGDYYQYEKVEGFNVASRVIDGYGTKEFFWSEQGSSNYKSFSPAGYINPQQYFTSMAKGVGVFGRKYETAFITTLSFVPTLGSGSFAYLSIRGATSFSGLAGLAWNGATTYLKARWKNPAAWANALADGTAQLTQIASFKLGGDHKASFFDYNITSTALEWAFDNPAISGFGANVFKFTLRTGFEGSIFGSSENRDTFSGYLIQGGIGTIGNWIGGQGVGPLKGRWGKLGSEYVPNMFSDQISTAAQQIAAPPDEIKPTTGNN